MHMRARRGILSGEALADFAPKTGANGSFLSSRSMLAWTLAGVVAGEYPSKWVQVGVYSVASGVSLTRVLGQEHFQADVLVRGAAGWMIGHYVFEKHHVYHGARALRARLATGR
jgi:hypothetical protein